MPGDDDAATTTEPPAAGDVGDAGRGDAGTGEPDIAARIAEGFETGLQRVVSALGLSAGDPVTEPEAEPAPATAPPANASAAQTEAHVASQVRAELDRIGAERETAERLAAVEAKVQEPPPVKRRTSTRLMGW